MSALRPRLLLHLGDIIIHHHLGLRWQFFGLFCGW
jgi:hypothetical protein